MICFFDIIFFCYYSISIQRPRFDIATRLPVLFLSAYSDTRKDNCAKYSDEGKGTWQKYLHQMYRAINEGRCATVTVRDAGANLEK